MPLFLKDAKSTKPTPIRLQISLNGKVHHYATGETILPGEWDKVKQKAKTGVKYPLGENLNLRLMKVVHAEGLVRSRFKTDGERPTWFRFKLAMDRQLERKEPATQDFWSFVEIKLSSMKDRLKVNHMQTYKVLKEYEEGRISLDFGAFDLTFYERFVHWCRNKKKYSNNTIGKHIKTLKSWLNAAYIEGVNKSLLFKTYKVYRERTEEIYLTYAEIESFVKLELEGLELQIRDAFVIGCYTALRYGDYKQATKKNIHRGDLHLYQSKTSEPVVIPLRPECLEIIERHGGFPKPPINQVMNRHLKTLALRAGLPPEKAAMVKTHTARRSFATNLFLDGFPVSDIMRITGHKSERSFILYIRSTNMDAANRLRSHWNIK